MSPDSEDTPLADWVREHYGDVEIGRPSWGTVGFASSQLALGFVFGVVVALVVVVDAASKRKQFDESATTFEITATGLAEATWPLVAIGTAWFAASALSVIWLDVRNGGGQDG